MTPALVHLYAGNRRYLTFRLRKKGQTGFVNVSTAQQIRLEYKRVNDSSLLAPIIADRNAPGADWVNGRVLFMVDATGLTARTGTYQYAVTVVTAGEEHTYHSDVCEVLDRPLRLPSTDPDATVPVSYTATSIETGINVSDTPITAGMAISRFGAGIIPADWLAYNAADGVAISDAPAGYLCLYVGAGSRVRRADWTAITGQADLPATPANALYLAADGRYTAVEPTLPSAAIKQVVGEVGADGQTIIVTLDYLVTL